MKYVKKILNVALWVFIVLLFILLIINIYFIVCSKILKNDRATFFGYTYQVGMNYSMEPTLKANDFLITKQQQNYEVGDIITFIAKDSKQITTHRIVEVTETGYVTKGDYLVATDKPISKADVIGKVVVVIPFVGAVLRIMQNPFGAVLIIAIIVVAGVLIKKVTNRKSDSDKNVE